MLIIKSQSTAEFALSSDKNRYSIGRDPSNDLLIEDESATGLHACIFHEIGKAEVVDLGSRNGTRLNGKPVNGRQEIHSRDKIRLGDTVLGVIDPCTRRPTRLQPAVSDWVSEPGKLLAILRPTGNPIGNSHEIKGATKIGRSPDNDLVTDVSTASVRHAEIRPTPQGQEVVDLDSTNGTYVNESRIDRQILKNGDRLRVDETGFVVSIPGAGPAKTRVNPAIVQPAAKTQVNPSVCPPSNAAAQAYSKTADTPAASINAKETATRTPVPPKPTANHRRFDHDHPRHLLDLFPGHQRPQSIRSPACPVHSNPFQSLFIFRRLP